MFCKLFSYYISNFNYNNIFKIYYILSKVKKKLQKLLLFSQIHPSPKGKGLLWQEDKKDIVKSILLNKIGKTPYKIFARKCEIRKVNHSEATQFLDNNHLQGKCISSQHYGLYFNNELVCLLSISKSRFSKKYEWEITRFCNKNYYSIVGGFSKLLKHFIKNHNPNNIVTYADKRLSLGGLYLKNDFKYLQDTPPNYYYFYNTKDYVLFNRIAFQKHKLEKKLKTFSPERTEWENMMDNGYDRIWDCGNMVFEWKKEG